MVPGEAGEGGCGGADDDERDSKSRGGIVFNGVMN
jgi:hypothetical protein